MNQDQEIELLARQEKKVETQSPEKTPAQSYEPAKKILYDQTLFATFAWGISNFFYGMLETNAFSVSCLQFTGFLLVSLGFKITYINRNDHITKDVIIKSFFGPFYDIETHKVNYENVFHLIIRTINFFFFSWLIIISSYYAQLAEINFGIISSCISISTVFNCVFSYFFFGEKLTKKQLLGIFITLVGIVWVSLAKGKVLSPEEQIKLPEEERNYYRILSVSFALLTGFLNSLRTAQAKYVYKKFKYSPMEFSVDSGITCGVILLILGIYYFISGEPLYDLQTLIVSFIASSLFMLMSFVGLNAMVKGLSGPTSAIIYTNSIIQIILNAIVLQLIPTFLQICGSIIAIVGVIVMMVFK